MSALCHLSLIRTVAPKDQMTNRHLNDIRQQILIPKHDNCFVIHFQINEQNNIFKITRNFNISIELSVNMPKMQSKIEISSQSKIYQNKIVLFNSQNNLEIAFL